MTAFAKLSKFFRSHPTQLVLVGFAAYICIGWGLLNLPFLQQKHGAGLLDTLFVSTSSVTTTSLSPVPIPETFNVFGIIVILILMQLGGIGYMTLTSFVVLAMKEPLSSERKEVTREIYGLPKNFRVARFIRGVVWFTFAVEAAGAVALYFIFRAAGVPAPLWGAVFHSVAAFTTTGFSLYGNSLHAFAGNAALNIVMAALAYLGAIGFIVWSDLWRRLLNRRHEVALITRMMLHVTLWLLVAGTLLIFFFEPSIRAMPAGDRMLAAFFQTMSASTTLGYSTIDISRISGATMMALTALMIIGTSPSGTGGGVKCTTAMAVFGTMKSALLGRRGVSFWGRRVRAAWVQSAMAALSFYIAFLLAGTYLLSLTEHAAFQKILFEAASALGTVGLTAGVTAALSAAGKIVMIALMFVGRLSPLTVTLAFLGQSAEEPEGGPPI